MVLTTWPATVSLTASYCQIPITTQNNRAERSHESTRFREGGMRRFKSARHAQSFLSIYSEVRNLFNLARHLIKASHYRNDRKVAFAAWVGRGRCLVS
jgi:transposase-like protein